MIYMRLTRLNGELTVDEGLFPCPSLAAQEEDDMGNEPVVYGATQLMRRLKPGWAITIECEGQDAGDGLDP
jgi:hypothetical protein